MIESKFYVSLKMEKISPGIYKVLEDFPYQSRRLDTVLFVPKGFVTDLASVPRLPIVYMLTGGTSDEAAVIHDFLYQKHYYIKDGKPKKLSRRQADLVFMEANSINEPRWRVEMMYLGVRAGGWNSWRTGPKRYRVLNETSFNENP